MILFLKDIANYNSTALNLRIRNVIFFFIVFCNSAIVAQTNPYQVSFPQPLKNLTPDKIYTLVVEIKNNQDKESSIQCQLEIPLEFQAHLLTKKLTFKANEKKIVLFTFKVGKNVLANEYDFLIKLYAENVLLTTASEKINIKATNNLKITPIKVPDYIRFEDVFYCEYALTNEGNKMLDLEFDSFNHHKIIPPTISLMPDSTVTVKVFQKVPKITHKTVIVNSIYARITKQDTLFSSQTTVDLFPEVNEKSDLYHRFPIQVSSFYNSLKGFEKTTNYRYLVDGNGYLDKHQKHFLNFNYSGPSDSDLLRFGIYEKYHILYKSKNLEATFGDINYTFSPITEFSRNGKGGIVNYSKGKVTSSFFYLEPRFTDQIKKSLGGKISWIPFNNLEAEIGVLNRILFENNEDFSSTIYNISSNYVGTFYNVGGEIAMEQNYKSKGFAYALNASLAVDQFNFDSNWNYSDKNYLGYLRNSKQLNLNTQYKFSKQISLGGHLYHSYINPVKDSINYSTSPKIKRNQIFFNLNINAENTIRLGLLNNRTEDQLLPKKFDFKEQLINLTYTYQPKNNLYINSFSRYGKSVNFLSTDNSDKDVFFSTLQITKTFYKNLEVGLSGDYQRTNKVSLTNELTNSIFYGGFVRYKYNKLLQLNVFYRSDYNTDELTEPQSYLEGKLSITPHQNHQFTFSASEAIIPSVIHKKELLLSVGYNFKVNTPLYKDKTKGEFHGKIIGNKGENVEGIILQLDEKVAITNKVGAFSFYNLVPSEYHLSVRQSSLPKSKIIYENLPQQISILPNKKTEMEYTIGDGFTVTGKIQFNESKNIISSQQELKLPPIVVKISNENKVFLTKTDDKGNFEFKELNYGIWKIELIVPHLKNDFQFETTQKTLEIKGETNNIINFKVTKFQKEVIRSQKQFKL